MTIIVALWIALTSGVPDNEVTAFRATAPPYLNEETARQNLVAARAAAVVHRIPAELLLAIAYHESRYRPTTRTAEPGDRVSCGVMTPYPKARCAAAELTLLGGYDEGARHLRDWLQVCRGNIRCAILAYAGGGALAGACVRHREGSCAVADVIAARADQIHRALATAERKKVRAAAASGPARQFIGREYNEDTAP